MGREKKILQRPRRGLQCFPHNPLAPEQEPGRAQTSASLTSPFSGRQEASAESWVHPARGADVGEGEGKGLARVLGGPGRALDRAGSGGGTPKVLPPECPSPPAVLPVGPLGRPRIVQTGRGDGDTGSDSPTPTPLFLYIIFSRYVLSSWLLSIYYIKQGTLETFIPYFTGENTEAPRDWTTFLRSPS